MDASLAGAGSWLKYIRVACSCDNQNLTMCQINEQVGPGLAHGGRLRSASGLGLWHQDRWGLPR